ncbi:hypothetical protein QVA66_07890 [Staphylococcus chromogenes]|nr:hypothetical protein [Staphylococcus chromogenes]
MWRCFTTACTISTAANVIMTRKLYNNSGCRGGKYSDLRTGISGIQPQFELE